MGSTKYCTLTVVLRSVVRKVQVVGLSGVLRRKSVDLLHRRLHPVAESGGAHLSAPTEGHASTSWVMSDVRAVQRVDGNAMTSERISKHGETNAHSQSYIIKASEPHKEWNIGHGDHFRTDKPHTLSWIVLSAVEVHSKGAFDMGRFWLNACYAGFHHVKW